MAVKYKMRCIKCKKNYVTAGWKDRYVLCHECQAKDLAGEIKDPALRKLCDIPEHLLRESSFLREIKIKAIKYNSLSEKQIEAFKNTVEKLKNPTEMKSSMPNAQTMAVLFDLGGVVFKGGTRDVLRHLNDSLGLRQNFIVDLYNQYREDMLTGKIDSTGFCKIILKSTSLKLTPKELYGKWAEAQQKAGLLDKKLLTLIKKLHDTYKVGCLSNATKFDVEMDLKQGIRKYFDPYLNSCDCGLMKPQAEFFELALRELNLKAEQVVFIDDKPENIEAAKKLRFNTVLFKDNKQLAKELNSLAVIF